MTPESVAESGRLGNFIDGRRQAPSRGLYTAGGLPDSCELDLCEALGAAGRALEHWPLLGRPLRARALDNLARRILLESSDPFNLATALSPFRFPGDGRRPARLDDGPVVDLASVAPRVARLVLPTGIGVAAIAERTAPLLAAGYCLVVGLLHKPVGGPPGTSLRALANIACWLPDGVLNVVCGRAHSIGRALVHTRHAVTVSLPVTAPPVPAPALGQVDKTAAAAARAEPAEAGAARGAGVLH